MNITEAEFAKRQAEMLKEIPTEFKPVLAYMAWERGHSAGYQEVLNILEDLVATLKKPLEDYRERVIQEEFN